MSTTVLSNMVNQGQPTSTKIPTQKILLLVIIVSMSMLFAGLTSAFIVRQAEPNWLEFALPGIFSLSTAVIFISSFSMHWSLRAAKKGLSSQLVRGLAVTLALGLVFVLLQFMAWEQLVSANVFFAGKMANPAGSFLYVLTGLHLAHVLGGILYLSYVLFVSFKNYKIPAVTNLLSIELCTIYWHFLGGLWIYLFLFLHFTR